VRSPVRAARHVCAAQAVPPATCAQPRPCRPPRVRGPAVPPATCARPGPGQPERGWVVAGEARRREIPRDSVNTDRGRTLTFSSRFVSATATGQIRRHGAAGNFGSIGTVASTCAAAFHFGGWNVWDESAVFCVPGGRREGDGEWCSEETRTG
jgi:hypothetical protein